MTISFGLCTIKWRKNAVFAKYANFNKGKIKFTTLKQIIELLPFLRETDFVIKL